MLRISGNKVLLSNIGIKCGVVCNSDGHKGRPGVTGRFDLACNHGALEVPLDDIGLDDVARESGDPAGVAIRFRMDTDQTGPATDDESTHVSEEQVA